MFDTMTSIATFAPIIMLAGGVSGLCWGLWDAIIAICCVRWKIANNKSITKRANRFIDANMFMTAQQFYNKTKNVPYGVVIGIMGWQPWLATVYTENSFMHSGGEVEFKISFWVFRWAFVRLCKTVESYPLHDEITTTNVVGEKTDEDEDKDDVDTSVEESSKTKVVLPMVQQVQQSPYRGSGHTDSLVQIAYHPSLIPPLSIEVGEKMLVELKRRKESIGIFNGVFILHGKPGTGKTTCYRWLAHKLGATLWNTFDPTEPGVVLDDTINAFRPTEDTPILLGLDEVDHIFRRFGNIPEHKHLRTMVRNKSSWNGFLDALAYYDNSILVMTTNLTLEQLRTEFDESLLREGRVNAFYKM
jgi:hypothetical protein